MTSRNYPDLIQFQKRTTTTNAAGQDAETWTTKFPRRGKVTQTGGGQSNRHGQNQTDADYMINIPFSRVAAAITERDWRIVWKSTSGDVVLNLVNVNGTSFGRRRELVMSAKLDR